MNGSRRGILNRLAPGAREGGERDREESPEESDLEGGLSADSAPGVGVGEGGIFALGAVWNGMSVGEIYLRGLDGPEPARAVLSDSSSIGVMGGGGVSGVPADDIGLAARGEGAKGDVEDRALRALRERWERRDREEAPAGEPTVLGDGVSSPPAASKMLPRSLPYGGGGASVPELGASPHFFTLASMKTKPDWPKLM